MKNTEKQSFIEKNSKKLLIILILLVAVIGSTYAWFTLTIHGEKKTVIHAGKLSLNLDEKTSEGISLLNAYPLTDQEGLATDDYTFTLTNDGNIATSYTIYLKDITENPKKLDVTVIKYNLTKILYDKNDTITSEPIDTRQLLSDIKIDEDIILDTGVLQPNEHNEYSLKMWMDYDAGNEYQNCGFNGQLKIVGNQIDE